MSTAQKVFESIYDVSLNDILEYECFVKMNEYKGDKTFVLHISELSFQAFNKYYDMYFDHPVQEESNNRYFIIITPQNSEQYLKCRDMSVRQYFRSYYIDSQHHIKRRCSGVASSFIQRETFDKEFNQNLHKEIIKYLKTDQLDFRCTTYISKEEFVDTTGIDKEDTNNIEYAQVSFTDRREGEEPADRGITIRLINDNNKITFLDVDTDFVE